jgi:predicted enzyme related to lactoylglutathione lyase
MPSDPTERRPAVTDPLDVLREPDGPIAPDPAFAARLRARVERALELPRGVRVSVATPDVRTRADDQLTAATAVPAAAGAAIPYLAVGDARRAIAWYIDVFGAVALGDPIVMPDGRIGHAELALSGGKLYLADEYPEIGVVAPAPDKAAVSLVLDVRDVDARVAAATASGGRLTREIYEAYGSRNATIVDPFGHRWMLQQPLTTAPASEAPPAPWHQGDVGYVSLNVPDVERAAAFYSAVLGWTYERRSAEAQHVVGQSMHIGLFRAAGPPDLFCAYAVGDTDAAVERVRAAGGAAGAPTEQPWGRSADCVDNQGKSFALFAPRAHDPGERPPVNGARQGDLCYLTFSVAESAPVREFYGSVLGWRFAAGHANDGWQIEDVAPMGGIGGGADQPRTKPMWLVDDIRSAVERVRAAGGTATEIAQRPYGLESECVDDQGSQFYLGQL